MRISDWSSDVCSSDLWADALGEIASVARNAGNSVAAVAGDLLDCETMFAARQLVKALGGTMLEGRQTGLNYDVSNLAAVNFNSTIAGIEKSDVILLVGTNLRDRMSTSLNSSH